MAEKLVVVRPINTVKGVVQAEFTVLLSENVEMPLDSLIVEDALLEFTRESISWMRHVRDCGMKVL